MGNVARIQLLKKSQSAVANELPSLTTLTELPAEPQIIPIHQGQVLSNSPTGHTHQPSMGYASDTDKAPYEGLIQFLLRIAHFLLDISGATHIQVPGFAEGKPGRMRWMPLKSEEFRRWMRYLSCQPSEKDISDTIRLLDAKISQEYQPQALFNRFAYVNGELFINLANERGEVVHVTRQGWQISDQCSLAFIDAGLPLPRPERGGCIENLDNLLNTDGEGDFPKIVAWLVTAMLSKGACPILYLEGVEGSGKTVMTRLLRLLIDPVVKPLERLPKTADKLHQLALSQAVLAFNDVGTIKPEIVEALCDLSTELGTHGKTYGARESQLQVVNCRPIILNGTDAGLLPQEVLERAIVITIPPFDESEQLRNYEELIEQEFLNVHAGLFGVLLDGLASSLATAHTIYLKYLPRLADFVRYAAAAEPGFGWPRGTFYRLYSESLEMEKKGQLQNSLLGNHIVNYLLRDVNEWTGTMESLGYRWPQFHRDNPKYPRTGKAVSIELKNITSSLRAHGIAWCRLKRKNTERLIRLYRLEGFLVSEYEDDDDDD
jgi:hypothetical protein